ncbi:MAG: PorP/SprF family type IX secretion system membrane protein [Bacteroidota bacterium]|nr:PorP/SprF family type IX secretion system membrane protein [Bacteroidota bacterium]MDX5431387.1 PorP/SprF family type IX secretion system membrane protein [Bacteroidota bacterium]MDX5470117.1 PorP/SprF family type IX secretion system membrane protein [Bacteroidota bacterium]
MKKFLASILLLSCLSVNGQDAVFTQFYASPMVLNPALTGTGLCGGRAVMQYRNQWPSLGNNFRTFSFAYDQVAPSIGGAFGVHVMNDVAGDGLLATRAINAVYNYAVPLGKQWNLYMALQGSFIQRSIDFNKLQFADQIDPKKGFVKPTTEYLPNERVQLPSFSSGFLIEGKGMYAGVAVFHMNEPNQSFYGNSGGGTYLPRRVNVHGGMQIRLGNPRSVHHRKDLVLSPGILVSVQEKFSQVNLGFQAKKNGLITGIWWRQTGANPDAFIAIVGYQGENYKLGYSFDTTVSSARAAVKGSHEFSFAYQFCIKKPVKKNWLNEICPTF